MKSKVDKFREREYMVPGVVKGLIHMFAVDKGTHDKRMVFDGSGSGLNATLWAPHFGLPTVRCTHRSLLRGYWQNDMDIGEMFLCFWLHLYLRRFVGVDIRHLKTRGPDQPAWEQGRTRDWEHWVRNCMGLRDSPVRSLQLMVRAKFIAYGDRRDTKNPFHWERVVLNIPGSEDYDPTKPWVMKVRVDGHVACEVYVYVDDGRMTGHSRGICWKASRRFCAILNALGIQEAARKRSEPSMHPGPWAGSVTNTEGEVKVTVSREKWAKAKAQVAELQEMAKAGTMRLHRLRQIRGFLGYFVRTYRWGNPYLKGLHLTIDGWRAGCDPLTGWKRPVRRRSALIQDEEGNWVEDERIDEPTVEPEWVNPSPRLSRDLTHLAKLLEGDDPACELIRAGKVSVGYLLGDASGQGFGSGLFDGQGVAYESASWGAQAQSKSSNWREACNLTDRVLRLVRSGTLKGGELIIFTDNTTFESTFYKGYSAVSEELTDLVFSLRLAEREAGCIIHVVHIAGTRMKESGIDGLSRGDLYEGIMKGESPLKYIPLSQGAVERSRGRVRDWVNCWWNDAQGDPILGKPLRLLNPDDWFELYDNDSPRLWSPPPGAMETVIELFNEDRLAHPTMSHVFVIPRLMTHLFRRSLGKDADLMFEAASGSWFWPLSMHEPLIVAIVLPIVHVPSHRGPWVLRSSELASDTAAKLQSGYKSPELRGARKLLHLDSSVPGMRQDEEEWGGVVLRQFLETAARDHIPLSHGLLRGMLHSLPERSVPHPGQDRRR